MNFLCVEFSKIGVYLMICIIGFGIQEFRHQMHRVSPCCVHVFQVNMCNACCVLEYSCMFECYKGVEMWLFIDIRKNNFEQYSCI